MQVMVKVLETSYDDLQRRVEDEDDFFDEVHILSRLDHVNIIRLVGFVVASRPFWIVTQLPTVGCLRDYLRHAADATSNSASEATPLSLICRQMSSAVAYLADRR